MQKEHETSGMSYEEKVARCRQWLPGGKFVHEGGSGYHPRPYTVLEHWRNKRIAETPHDKVTRL